MNQPHESKKFIVLARFIMVALCLIVVGCRPSSNIDCEAITSGIPKEVPFDALNQDTIAEWVQESYQIPLNEVSIPDPAGNWTPVADVSWQTSQSMYQGEFSDGSLINIRLSWNRDNTLTADDIVRCLGEPDSYLTLYVSRQFELLLFYPERGLVVGSGSDTFFDVPPTSIETTPVHYFFSVRPNRLERVLSDTYSNNEGSLEFYLKHSRPWGNGWSDVTIERFD